MYGYTHDAETGGLLLNPVHLPFSKEPRPVYAEELDILGFDKHWRYEKQKELPYCWAESNAYWYRGVLIAKVQGGSIFTAPTLEAALDSEGNQVLPDGTTLQPVDIQRMVEKNQPLLAVIEQVTIKKIYDAYRRNCKKLDCFYVAFSGGKDSIVLLELVKKALPASSFLVVFGDTRMEFSDTYKVVDQVEEQCEKEKIDFYRASSHLEPEESWKLFGPPSRVLRWCCSVHKSVPQILKLRKVLKKTQYQGMAFVGVRSYESSKRDDQLTQKEIKLQNPDELAYIDSYSKIKGQKTTKSIYEWTSAEVWLYIYANNLVINEAYKKGCARVGCLCCPMGGSKADYIQYAAYANEMGRFTELISISNGRDTVSSQEYIGKGGWNARKNGRFLRGNLPCYSEKTADGTITIDVETPRTNWMEWMKSLGDLTASGEEYKIGYAGCEIKFEVKVKGHRYTVSSPESVSRNNPEFGKFFRYVFRKAAYCVGCGTCEANCRQHCISFDGDVKIDGCLHCHECLSLSSGCLAYDSLKIPIGEEQMSKAINCFSNHAPKTEWFDEFFEKQNDFFTNNTLGPVQKTKFKRFLKDAGLIEKNKMNHFAKLIMSLGWNTEGGLGLILANVSYNPQITWYIQNMEVGKTYSRSAVEGMLAVAEQSPDSITSILSAFKRLCDLPFGTRLNFGAVSEKGRQIESLTRGKSRLKDDRVVLYSLYKFAEACGNYYQFTLSRLMDDSVESEGISPTRIFGFDRDDMERFLNGLSVKYPEFISITFTHDLDKITLRSDKTSQDVLSLF